MKEEEVPQDNSNLSKSNIKELIYATDKEGNYVTTLSSGWEPKTIALNNSLEEINERINEAKERVANGEMSPIYYFMELNKMDIGILASYVEMWRWRVKRHFKPKIFKTLSDSVLMRYANAFNISLEELKNFKTE